MALLLGTALAAHALPDDASFEVASIKPSKPDDGRMMLRILPGAKFVGKGLVPRFLLEEAYNVKDAQVVQAPPWFNSEHYDIDAKPEDAVGAAMDKLPPEQRREKLMLMVQALLADRFKLALDHEKRDLPIYALVVAKTGSKLKPSTFVPSDKPAAAAPPPSKGGPPPAGGIWMQGPGKLESTGVSLSVLAGLLSRSAGRTVVDKTGLTGLYDFKMQWTPEEGQGPAAGAPDPAPEGASAPAASAPSLFTAIQEQLGLKLESQKASMDVLVIKHVEKPSEN